MTRKAKIIYIVGSVIIGVVSLLAVLLSLIASGAVDTRQTKLVYASVSGEFVYDGQAHGAEEWELVSGELRKGHQSVVTVSGTQKDVGESQNYLSAVIVDEGGADVSGYYEIEYQPGTLRVTPREITVTAQSKTKVYDGTPLVCTDFSVTGGQVAEGHTINASFGASVTQVGTTQNNISVALLDEEGRDVTANYAVTTRSGILEVTPRKLVLQSSSKSREYDGTILTEEEYAVSEGSLADGQSEKVTFNASLQNVGSMQNSFAAVIYASDGVTDVTSNYDLEYLYGTLEVTPRPLKITTQSGNKVYDGTALTDSGYEITAGSVAEGQEADIRVRGSITKVGKQENAVSVLIYDGGTDVTDNYRIEKETGTLEVTPRPLTIRVCDDTKVYDGTALTNAGYEITAGDVAAEQTIDVQTMGTQTTVGQSANTAAVTITDVAGEEVTSNYDLTLVTGVLEITPRKLVLQSSSKSREYDGTILTEEEYAVSEGSLADGQSEKVTFNASLQNVGSMQNSFAAVIYASDGVTDVTSNYDLECLYGTLEVTPRPLTIRVCDDTKVYDGTALTNAGYEITAGDVAAEQTIDVQTMGTQTTVGQSANTAAVTITDGAGEEVTSNYDLTLVTGVLEITPRKLVLQSSSKSKEYDGTILTEEEYAVSEGSLADGQSERVTFNASLQNVGSIQNSFAAVIYASDGVTDVTSNYDLECLYGTLEVTPRPLKITTQSGNKVYDGTALTDSGYEITAGSVAEGQEADIRVTGSITKVGKQENAVSVLIYDGGTDVTDNYRIEKETGTLEVTPRPLTIRVYDDTKVYDGTALTNAGYEITAGDVAAEQRIDVQTMGTQTTVGQSANTAAVTITDVAGEEVTSNYDLTLVTGVLEITPRKLVLQSSSKSKEYDGTILTEEEYAVSEGSLADGQSEKVTFNASLQNVGSMQNSFAAVIYASDGVTDVTSNYDLECLYGTLEVTPRKLVLQSSSKSKEYDGTILTEEEYAVSEGSLADGQSERVTFNASLQNVGSMQNSFAAVIYASDGVTDVTSNYDLECLYGTLEVTPRKLVLQSLSKSKEYDGTILTEEEYAVSEGSLADGQSEKVTFNASLQNVGSMQNSFAAVIYASDGVTDVTSNYDLECLYGTLEVTPRPLTIRVCDDTKVYDGTALTNAGYEITAGDVAAEQRIDVQTMGTQTTVGQSANTAAVTITDVAGEEVTSNYDITLVTGVLEITPRKLILQSLSKSREYDGTILTEEEYAVSEGSLADGQSERVTFNASLQNIGSMQNSFASVIYASDGVTDVTSNYDLECLYGTLEVTPRPLKITTQSGNKVYDGTALTDSGYEITAGSVAEGQEADIRVTGSITKVGKQENAVSVLIYDGGTDVTSNYDLECLYGTLEVTPRPLKITTQSGNKVYDGTALTNAGYEITAGDVAAEQTIDVQTMGTQTTVGQSANTAAVTITDVAGEEVTSNYDLTLVTGILEITPRKLVLQSLSKSREYDGTILTEEEYAVSEGSLADGQSEKVTFNASLQNVGSMQNSFAAVIYASDGVTDVTSNYDLECLYGTLEVTPRKLVLQSSSKSKEYDGTILTEEEYAVSEGSLADGQSERVTFNASLQNVGSMQNSFAAVIYASDGVTDVTSNYDLECLYGTLEVTPRKLVLQSLSKSKEYDGTILTEEEYAVSEGSLADGQSERVTFNASLQNVGSMQNSFAAVIYASDGVTDVTSNYDLECLYGTLEVTPRKLVLQSSSKSKEYDGTILTEEEYAVSEGSLADGQSEKVTFNASLQNVGSIQNSFAAVIYASDGVTDVTSNYDLECLYGTLEVTPRKLVLQSSSKSKEYDGTILTEEEYAVSEGSLADGQSERVTFNASLQNVGNIQNSFAAVIYASDGVTDVTSNYDLEYLYGTLEVTPYRISISTYSSVKIYDGLPLVAQTYTISSERQLIDGHEIASVTMPSSRTDAGTEENLITDIIILNADKEDVTANYEIEYFFGKLNVSPRPITIRSASAAKNYDGTPLTCDEWDYVSITRPLETHDVQVAVSGTRTEVGESDNTIAEVLITQDGQNVTSNYDITCELGVLVVKENASGGAGSGGSAGNTDISGNIGGGSPQDDTLAIRVYSDQSGKIYLRLTSFGDLNNAETKWEAAVPYEGLLDGKYSYNYLSGIALENAGYESSDVFIEVLGTDYYLPYYMTRDEGGYLIQQSDVLYEGSTEQIYNLTYFLYDLIGEGAVIGSLGEYSDAELAYRDWVYKQYTNYSLSSRLKEYFDGIIAEKGWDKEQDIAVLIGQVASFIQGAATYNLGYNRGLDSSSDIVYDFLQVYREGICQHYATAATVLLRYLGFPARYTVGYVGDTKSGEWVEITAANAHAWVEVYVSGFGWVQVEVTGGGPGGGSGGGSGSGSGGSGGGSGGLLPSQKLNVKPVDEYMLFDGVSVLTHSGKLQGLYDLEQQGYTYRATVSGSRKALGISTSKVEKFVLYDPDGNDVTDKFEIVFSEGILQVYIGIIRIKTEGGQKIYDGTALTNGQYSVESELLDGHFMQTEITGSQTDIGSNINTFSLQVLDGAGNDMTYMYRIIADYGILEVDAREITVIAKDAQKQADGTPLTCNEFVPLPDGALALGHQIQVEITGSQTNVGYSDNVVRSVVIYDSEGKDVTSNYIIKTQNGKLTVTI